MKKETIPLPSASPGTTLALQVLRFGTPGTGPKAYIQAALHADEVPALLAAHALQAELAALETAGRLRGEVVLVPLANPIGAGQVVLGQHQGRFDLRDGANFNRGYPELADAAASRLQGRLGSDEAANTALVRQALRDSAFALAGGGPTQALKRRLLQLAIDADIVLDLHCDAEAEVHLYALSPQAGLAAELGALLQARAVLLATESGDSPFDEACSRPWLLLQQRFAGFPLPLGCFSATVELRGEAQTSHALARADAQALVQFLARRGMVTGEPAPLPAAVCEPTPLSGSEPVTAPQAGVVVYRCEVGQRVQAGDVIADIVDAETGAVTPLACQSAGLLYARAATRWAWPGKRLAKIAGTSLARTGKLLSP